MMNTFFWKNTEGLNLYAENWVVTNPTAVIVLVHGQGEHIGRYAHVAEWYNKRGIALMAFDQQGYGKSGGQKGHAANLDVLLNDIARFVEMTKELYPGTPVFLYGHSMGGGLLLYFALHRYPDVDGMIITSPLIRLAFQAPVLKIMIGRLLRRYVPTLTLPTGLAANFISHDHAVVSAYKKDPLVHNKLSAAAGIALLEMGDWLDTFTGTISIPLLLMHGEQDRLTSSPASRAFSERVGGPITYKEWQGLWHEMHNESEKEQLFDYTLAWIKANTH
jgi:alpha-beta hydrolase superfamily lysophospholipase